MMGKYPHLIFACVLVLGGCAGPLADTPTAPPGDIPADSIKFLGEMGDNRSHFVMRGKLLGCWTYGMGPANCSDVTIELYAENGTHLQTFRIGYLNGSKNISLVAPVVPYYVLIRSPDFWGHNFTSISYYERFETDHYTVHSIGEREEFPDVINVTDGD